ncbi:hypothetical protein [Faecalibacter sp. LW9]|uniref:RHS repeat domain-containing protein n=1 Tax=Faecalibacter sp. LW9 TaxID=3103144 RepID=UPI002B000DD9|nr:hypothetical protein [Faecalibacter sp. LW9]
MNNYTYSPSLRRLSAMNAKQGNGEAMFDNTYTFDKVGNITQIANSATHLTNGLGGTFNFNYQYDDLNRLSQSTGEWSGKPVSRLETPNAADFSLEMTYDHLHNIVRKKQNHYDRYIQQENNSYENQYVYQSANSHRLKSIENNGVVTDEFKYDANGNITLHTTPEGKWNYFWDEANRLRSSVRDGEMLYHNIFDASGERVLKAESRFQMLYENGTPTDGGVSLESYTTYPSAFLTIGANSIYSKHYYAGTQRVMSRIKGSANIYNHFQLVDDDISISLLQEKQINDVIEVASAMEMGNVEIIERALPSFPIEETFKTPSFYFYHPDHLGTSSYITDYNGNAYQFFLNLSFGETMTEQKRSGSFDNVYKFNDYGTLILRKLA